MEFNGRIAELDLYFQSSCTRLRNLALLFILPGRNLSHLGPVYSFSRSPYHQYAELIFVYIIMIACD